MSERCDHPSSDGYWGYPDGVFKCTVCGQLHTDVPVGPDTTIVRTVNVVITDAARVPTDDELAALNVILRELDSADMIEHLDRNDAPGWGYPYDAVEALRAYLERQR